MLQLMNYDFSKIFIHLRILWVDYSILAMENFEPQAKMHIYFFYVAVSPTQINSEWTNEFYIVV